MYNGVYPVYIKPYTPQINKRSIEEVKKDPEKPKKAQQDPKEQSSSAGYEYKTAIDYKSNKVTINQILADFKNTLIAIGAPEDINEEVTGYLNLVDKQSQKPKPSQNIIRTNLKSAAEILDEYITKALNKNSKVVTNWVDAILLQNIEYKSPVKETQEVKVEELKSNPAASVAEEPVVENQIAKPAENQVQVENKPQVPEQKEPVRLENIKLKKLYRQSEKLVDSGNFEKALIGYEKALNLAQRVDDKHTEAQINMDIAYIHDVNYNLTGALEHYNSAANISKQIGDKEAQAKAHYNMATIYDDVGKVDTALEHYYAALAFDGETENIKGQALTLNCIGNMFAVKADYKNALSYYKLAFGLAKEQDDKAGAASILSNVAGVFRDLGYDKKALNYYKDAIKYDMEAGNVAGYAKSFEQAGDIMLKNGQTDKARNLYKKSMLASQQVGDRGWTARMSEKIDKAA